MPYIAKKKKWIVRVKKVKKVKDNHKFEIGLDFDKPDGAIILAALSLMGTVLKNPEKLKDKKTRDDLEWTLSGKLETLGVPAGKRKITQNDIEKCMTKIYHIFTKGYSSPTKVNKAMFNTIFWPDFSGGFVVKANEVIDVTSNKTKLRSY